MQGLEEPLTRVEQIYKKPVPPTEKEPHNRMRLRELLANPTLPLDRNEALSHNEHHQVGLPETGPKP